MSHVTTQNDAGVLVVTINRPEKKNALTAAMYAALADALESADRDKSVKVVLIEGAGDAFCAGNDLADFNERPPKSFDDPVFRFLHAVSGGAKPIVASVTGIAVGIGTTMLLHCDLAYAADDAKFMLPFVNLGICPEAASTFLLPMIAGYRRASELLLLGDVFDAQTAREVGLVNRVLPKAEVRAAAMAAARKMASKPSSAIRTTKALMRKWQDETMRRALEEEGRTFVGMLDSPEAKEAFAAFFEKRKPDFSKFD